MGKQLVSRRAFLRTAAITSVGAVVAACQPQTVIVKETVEVEKEKIVKETVVVEKQITPTPTLSGYSEAPMLSEQVKAGLLPPLEQRLPQDPMMLLPLQSVGEYGGAVNTVSDVAGQHGWDARIFMADRMVYPVRLDQDCRTVAPALASFWEISDDDKTLTLRLRKGVKWSDGEPCTADDIMFWFEDVVENDELTPVKPRDWSWNGELMEVSKADDYTVVLRFPESYPIAPTLLARGYLPTHYVKHYLQDYHPTYVDKDSLAKMTAEAGFEFWYQLFQKKANAYEGDEPYHPTLFAQQFTQKGVDFVLDERNPYFWAVDSAGNQLPYVDKVLSTPVANREVATAKILAGAVDFGGWFVTTENYPLYEENAEKGQYRVLTWQSVWGSEACFQPNQTAKDPVLRTIFQDVRFRRALSLGMDRDEINEALYFGQAEPRQQTVASTCRYYEPEFAQSYAQKDVEEANRLLDEMGLDKRDAEGYRLLPDGSRLTWQIDYVEAGERPREVVAELVIEQWRENLGIAPTLKGNTGALIGERIQANDVAMNLADCDNTMDTMFIIRPHWAVPMFWGWSQAWSPQWGLWYTTNGEQGEEPPPNMIELLDKWERMKATLDEEERTQLGKEILRYQAENLNSIGTVGFAPVPIIVAENMRNVPEEQLWGWDCYFGSIFNAPTWYLKQPLLERQQLQA